MRRFVLVAAAAAGVMFMPACAEPSEDYPRPTGAWVSVDSGSVEYFAWNVFRSDGQTADDECVAASLTRPDGSTLDAAHPDGVTAEVDGVTVPLDLPTHRGRGFVCYSRESVEQDSFQPFYLAFVVDDAAGGKFGGSFFVGVLPKRVDRASVELSSGKAVEIVPKDGFLVAASAPSEKLAEVRFILDGRRKTCRVINAATSDQFGCTTPPNRGA